MFHPVFSLFLWFSFKWVEQTKWKKAAMELHQLRSVIFFILHPWLLLLTNLDSIQTLLLFSRQDFTLLALQVDPSKPPSLTWKRKLNFTGKSPESFSFTLTDAWHLVINSLEYCNSTPWNRFLLLYVIWLISIGLCSIS